MADSGHFSRELPKNAYRLNCETGTAGKVYPIPPRRTKKASKIRSSSSSTLCTLIEDEHPHSVADNLAAVCKRPLREQYSNPELSRKVVSPPPRPPPPRLEVPSQAFMQAGGGSQLPGRRPTDVKQRGRTTVVIDTRGRRRHSDTPKPQRPPLPYETFVPNMSNQVHENAEKDDDTGSEHNEQCTAMETSTSPADYEEFVPKTSQSTISPFKRTSDTAINALETVERGSGPCSHNTVETAIVGRREERKEFDDGNGCCCDYSRY